MRWLKTALIFTAPALVPVILFAGGYEEGTPIPTKAETTIESDQYTKSEPAVKTEPTIVAKPTMKPAREFTDSSKQIEVTVGEDFIISLASNPTTGYSWRISGKIDQSIVQLKGTEFHPSESELVGAGGRRDWTFKAVGRGKTTILLENVRPWEKNKRPARKASFTVIAR